MPFTPGRADAAPEQTNIKIFKVLQPIADGFRNYLKGKYTVPPESLAGGQGAVADPDRAGNDGADRRPARDEGQLSGTTHGVFTQRPEALTNDFFVNLLDMGTEWKPVPQDADVFEGRDRKTGDVKWTGTRVDLVFGSNSILRALAEVYAVPTRRRSSSTTLLRLGIRS